VKTVFFAFGLVGLSALFHFHSYKTTMSSSEVVDVLRVANDDSDVNGLISEFAAPLPILNAFDWKLFCWMVTSGCQAEPFQKEFQKGRRWRMEDEKVGLELREPTLVLFEELKDSIGSWTRNEELEVSIAQEFKDNAEGGTVRAFVEAFQPESKKLREAGYALIAIGIDKTYNYDMALVLTKEDRYVIISSESGHPHAITPEFDYVYTHGSSPMLYNPLDNVTKLVSRDTGVCTYIQDEVSAEEKIQGIFNCMTKYFTRFCDQDH
jgi:hypothetical protein